MAAVVHELAASSSKLYAAAKLLPPEPKDFVSAAQGRRRRPGRTEDSMHVRRLLVRAHDRIELLHRQSVQVVLQIKSSAISPYNDDEGPYEMPSAGEKHQQTLIW